MVLESLGCNGLVLSSLCQEQQELVLRYVGNRNRCIFHFLAVSGYLQMSRNRFLDSNAFVSTANP